MKICCISDLHGNLPILESGDLLLIAGDITADNKVKNWMKFFEWLEKQNYKKKIVIAGNHDNFLENACTTKKGKELGLHEEIISGYEYLCDNFTIFEGLKIYGTPWTKWFHGINPHCKAFTKNSERQLEGIYSLIPTDTNILITHNPPYGIFDHFKEWGDGEVIYTGSYSLKNIVENIKPKIHLFGHIHEHGEKTFTKIYDAGKETIYINASIMNPKYEPVNKPIYITI